ncbi:MAG: NAD(P)-dependent alcohol dehydrogenase [Leptospiraceae bacterium]|nr:NAD(P)-dependent alcohol dehydrogenase [Leptospiraceae bacterium]
MKVLSYAALKEKSLLEKYEYEKPALKDNEVEVKITHCGICHSDIHLIDNDWGISKYPLIPGHEIIGTVEETGKNVKHLKKGMRVGIGWQADSCGYCEYCLKGMEQLCSRNQPTCVGRPGGFAHSIIVNSKFAIPVPDNLDSVNAAPLLCAGITVYNPLRIYNVKPSMRVGIIGIGGLGHLAIQFAHAFGCEVTAFSSTKDKEEEAKRLGAHNFVSIKDTSVNKYKNYFDFIISTVFVDLDWKVFISLLKPNGQLNFVGAGGSINIPIPMLLNNKIISGSAIGSPSMIYEMFQFAARHNIQAKTEVFPLENVNEAIQKVKENRVRYRAVLKI